MIGAVELHKPRARYVLGQVLPVADHDVAVTGYRVYRGTTQIANTLVAATPVLLTGLATAVAFRSGIFNVGVEGSLYVGAFAAAWAGFTLKGLPGPLLIVVAVILAGSFTLLHLSDGTMHRAFMSVVLSQ